MECHESAGQQVPAAGALAENESVSEPPPPLLDVSTGAEGKELLGDEEEEEAEGDVEDEDDDEQACSPQNKVPAAVAPQAPSHYRTTPLTLSSCHVTQLETQMLDALNTVSPAGTFAVAGSVQVAQPLCPDVCVDGVGRLGLPLCVAQAAQLSAAAEDAPFGKGTETLVDKSVRDAKQVNKRRRQRCCVVRSDDCSRRRWTRRGFASRLRGTLRWRRRSPPRRRGWVRSACSPAGGPLLPLLRRVPSGRRTLLRACTSSFCVRGRKRRPPLRRDFEGALS